MKLLAIDPGTTESGWVRMDGMDVMSFGKNGNEDVLRLLYSCCQMDVVVIEQIASYGMAVGKEVFATVHWSGRFHQAIIGYSPVVLLPRREVKLALCGTPRANDSNVRQAVMDLYPATGGGSCPQKGTKANPGPLYGMSKDMWQALALGVAYQQIQEGKG